MIQGRGGKKIDVVIPFHISSLSDTPQLMRLSSDTSAAHTNYLNRYRTNLHFTEMVVVQDDDAGGGETYTLRIYLNGVLSQTETLTSGTANTPVLKTLSSLYSVTLGDIISMDIKSSNTTAGDEIILHLYGYYLS
tara:strand:- start:2307 stop:2711 length:405 start_codon:yes stop_codon:yes gene_type:complete